ncbi:MAG: hypothetical protein AAB675_03885 [Patescibacteria group bacterium]
MPDQLSPEQKPNQEAGRILREFNLVPIPQGEILKILDLNVEVIPESLKASVQKSEWFSADSGSVLVELRNRAKLYQEPQGLLYVSDFDDTLFAATQWHNEEFRRLATDPSLQGRGINIPEDVGKRLYGKSKFTLPGTNAQRYHPKVNLILASIYAKAIERGEPQEQAEEKTDNAFNKIKDDLIMEGKISLENYDIDEDILRCLLGNHTNEYVYPAFARYFSEGTEEKGIRTIVSRGTIEDAFGQVYKLHTSGILEQGLGTDIVLYTTDLKAEYLPILYQLLPDSSGNGTRVFDDNPDEIDEYISWAKEHKLSNWEVIRVVHAETKRVNYLGSNNPDTTWGNQTPRFELYSASDDAPKTDLPKT